MSAPLDTLTALPVPVPPQLEAAIGYSGDARYVAFFWEPSGDEAMYDDGRLCATGDWWGWQAYTDHPRVEPALYDYHFGNSDEPAQHWLVVDRTARKAYVADVRTARRFIERQHPPLPILASPTFQTLTPDDLSALVGAMREVQPPTMEQIEQQMAQKAQLCDELAAWLNSATQTPQGD